MVKRHKAEDFTLICFIERKIYKAKANLQFLTQCKTQSIFPKFTHINKKVLAEVNWSRQKILDKKNEKLNLAICTEQDRLQKNYIKLNNYLETVSLSLREKRNLMFNCKKYVAKTEQKNDKKRENKFKKLNLNKSGPDLEKIKIHNFTNIVIPGYIIDILQYGADNGIGGVQNNIKLLREVEKLVEKWTKYARSIKIDPIVIFETKNSITNLFRPFRNCRVSDNKGKILSKYLNNNEDLCLIKCDKSKDLVFLYKKDYLSKLGNELSPDKYERLSKDPLCKDLKDFKKLLSTLEPYVDKMTLYKIRPIPALKRGYGLLKIHKDQPYPLRPIISSLNSMVSGVEEFILPILEKFLPMCVNSLSSTKTFTESFLNERNTFDNSKYDVISLDVVKMYPNVDVKFTVKFIVDKIYDNLEYYFGDNIWFVDENGPCYPPKEIFYRFLDDVCRKYTAFTTQDGFFRQTSGLSMGSKLSPIISNIFLTIKEGEIVGSLLEQGLLRWYRRYVDDCILIVPKSVDKNIILSAFNNNGHDQLQFKMDLPTNGRLNFLDTSIYFDERVNLYEFCNYQRATKSNVIMNYYSIAPRNYKLGTLCGEVYRMGFTSSNENNLNKSLLSLTNKFERNGYPRSLIECKIKEIRSRKFCKKNRDVDYENDRKEFPEKFFNFIADYTDPRCDKVAGKMRSIIRQATPDFQLLFSWKTVNLNSVIMPRLKKGIDKLNISGCVYKFECPCSEFYIGETQRILYDRIGEHGRISKKTHIFKHISECTEYKNELNKTLAHKSTRQIKAFLGTKFEILQKNLQNYRNRKIEESLFILLFNPTLNKKDEHKNLNIL